MPKVSHDLCDGGYPVPPSKRQIEIGNNWDSCSVCDKRMYPEFEKRVISKEQEDIVPLEDLSPLQASRPIVTYSPDRAYEAISNISKKYK